MDDQGMAPTVRERVSSTAITVAASALAGIATAVVLGLAVWFLQAALGVTVPVETITVPGSIGRVTLIGFRVADPSAGQPIGWLAGLLWLVVVVVVWLASCRGGAGTPGDAVMTLRAHSPGGGLASRARVLARTGIPVALYAVAVLIGVAGGGLLVLALLWVPALVRADRRTAVDLLVGVVPRSLAPARTGRSWPAAPADPSSPVSDRDAPTA